MKTVNDVTRTRKWREVHRRLRDVTDNNGTPIDPGILETCIILNVLDFSTQMSCEGHLDRGLPYPWVDLNSAAADAAYTQASVCMDHSGILQHPPQEPATYEEAVQRQALLDEASTWRRQAWHALALEGSRLFTYLQTFYTTRDVTHDQQLILHTDVAVGRLLLASQGGPLLLAKSEESRPALLAAYRQEMQAFTAFLSDCYRHMIAD